MSLLVGTSGWHYADWKGRFYPASLRSEAWLGHYSERFQTVELNNAFYRLPTVHAFRTWARQVPEDFVIAVKASRYLTHVKRLHDPQEPVQRLLAAARGLGPHLGPVLVQLPQPCRPTRKLWRRRSESFPSACVWRWRPATPAGTPTGYARCLRHTVPPG